MNYFNGDFTGELQSWANERVPQVTQLFESEVLASTYDVTGQYNPYQASTQGNVYYPNWRVSPGNASTMGCKIHGWMPTQPITILILPRIAVLVTFPPILCAKIMLLHRNVTSMHCSNKR